MARKPPSLFAQQIESVLNEAGRAFRRLEKDIPGMLYIHTVQADGTQLLPYVTHGCRLLFDVSAENLMKDPTILFELIHPEDRERRDSAIRRMVETQHPGREVLRHVVKGETRWYDCMAIPERQPNGDTHLYGFMLEITERMKAEQELRFSRKRLALAFEAVPNGFAIVTLQEGRYIEVNSGECSITGFSRKELVGRTTLELGIFLHPEDRKQLVEKLSQDGVIRNFEFQFRKKSGEVRWGRVSAALTEIESVTCMIREFSDITEQRQALEELKLSEERLRLAIEATQIGLYDVDIPNGIAVRKASVLEEKALVSTKPIESWLKMLHPDDQERTMTAYRQYLDGEKPEYSVEFRLRTKSGDWKWIHSQGKIVAWDSNGKPLRMVGTHTDITHRKEYEAVLQQQRDLLARRAAQLEGANQALIAALQHRDAEKRAIEESVFLNLKKLILPNILALSGIKLPIKAAAHLKIIRDNLEQAVDSSPFSAAIRYRDLTPKETQVAEFIRQGLATKEISKIMGITPGSVSFHRNRIRDKLRLKNRKHNLRRFLSETA